VFCYRRFDVQDVNENYACVFISPEVVDNRHYEEKQKENKKKLNITIGIVNCQSMSDACLTHYHHQCNKKIVSLKHGVRAIDQT